MKGLDKKTGLPRILVSTQGAFMVHTGEYVHVVVCFLLTHKSIFFILSTLRSNFLSPLPSKSIDFSKEIPMTKDKPRYLNLCPVEALKNVKDATAEELDSCVEGDVAGRYAGNIDITK